MIWLLVAILLAILWPDFVKSIINIALYIIGFAILLLLAGFVFTAISG